MIQNRVKQIHLCFTLGQKTIGTRSSLRAQVKRVILQLSELEGEIMPQIATTVPASSFLVTTVATNLNTFNPGGGNEITKSLKSFAARFNALVAIYNQWINHTHNGFDDIFVDPGTTYAGSTGGPLNTSNAAFGALALTVTVGQKMTAANVNQLVTAINAIRTHRHNIYDDV